MRALYHIGFQKSIKKFGFYLIKIRGRRSGDLLFKITKKFWQPGWTEVLIKLQFQTGELKWEKLLPEQLRFWWRPPVPTFHNIRPSAAVQRLKKKCVPVWLVRQTASFRPVRCLMPVSAQRLMNWLIFVLKNWRCRRRESAKNPNLRRNRSSLIWKIWIRLWEATKHCFCENRRGVRQVRLLFWIKVKIGIDYFGIWCIFLLLLRV